MAMISDPKREEEYQLQINKHPQTMDQWLEENEADIEFLEPGTDLIMFVKDYGSKEPRSKYIIQVDRERKIAYHGFLYEAKPNESNIIDLSNLERNDPLFLLKVCHAIVEAELK